jgi:hypothetical protein
VEVVSARAAVEAAFAPLVEPLDPRLDLGLQR